MFKDKEIVKLLEDIYLELRQIKCTLKNSVIKGSQKNIKGETTNG